MSPQNQFKGFEASNRASFISRAAHHADRKPEELDAVANELLSEFVSKKNENALSSGSSSSSASSQPKVVAVKVILHQVFYLISINLIN